MKLLIFFAAFLGVSYAQFQKSSPIAPPKFKPSYRQTGLEEHAETIQQAFDINPDGSYLYTFDTENGISASQDGVQKSLPGFPPSSANKVTGSYSYTAPDGQLIKITYEADENGYRATGNAIPTPPPIPAYILRSIEFNNREAAKASKFPGRF